MILSLPAEDLHKLEEIRLRCGQPLMLRFSNRECSLGSSGRAADKPGSEYVVNQQDIQRTIASISDNSLYAFEEEISRGYITIPGGHRIGLAGKAILDGKRVRTLKDFSGIAFRIAREVKDSSLPLLNHICGRNAAINNTLLISPPRCGKTTILRDIVRNLSSGGAWGPGYNITLLMSAQK
jgi:stage III sporulation protein AA